MSITLLKSDCEYNTTFDCGLIGISKECINNINLVNSIDLLNLNKFVNIYENISDEKVDKGHDNIFYCDTHDDAKIINDIPFNEIKTLFCLTRKQENSLY